MHRFSNRFPIINQLRLAITEQQAGERLLGALGGFELVMEVKRFGRDALTGSLRMELT